MSLSQRLMDAEYPPPPLPSPNEFWRAVEKFLDLAMPIYLSHGWWPAGESNPREQLRESIESSIRDWHDNPRILASLTAHHEVRIGREEVTNNYEIQISLVLVTDMARSPWE